MAQSQAYEPKTWVDRVSLHANRRLLTDTTTGNTQTVDVTRDPEEVQTAGDAFNAHNMNELETRIDAAFKTHEVNFQAGVDKIVTRLRELGYSPSQSTPDGIVAAINSMYSGRYNSGLAAVQSDSLDITAVAAINLSGNIDIRVQITNRSLGRPLYDKQATGTPASVGFEEIKTAQHSYTGRISQIV